MLQKQTVSGNLEATRTFKSSEFGFNLETEDHIKLLQSSLLD
jgi:hypothetical protein